MGSTGWVYLCAFRALSTKKNGVYLTIQGPDAGQTYEKLVAHRAGIEHSFGAPLDWTVEREGSLYSIGAGTAPSSADESTWPQQQSWLAQTMKRFEAALAPALFSEGASTGI